MRRLAAEQADLDRAERQRRRQLEGAYEATVVSSTATTVDVVVDALGDRVIGPAPYSRVAVGVVQPAGDLQYPPPGPPSGTRVLVMFAEGSVSQPWVVAIRAWP